MAKRSRKTVVDEQQSVGCEQKLDVLEPSKEKEPKEMVNNIAEDSKASQGESKVRKDPLLNHTYKRPLRKL